MLVLVLCILGLITPALFGGKLSRLAFVRFRDAALQLIPDYKDVVSGKINQKFVPQVEASGINNAMQAVHNQVAGMTKETAARDSRRLFSFLLLK